MRARDVILERWYGVLRFWYVLTLEGRSFFYRMRILLSRNHHADFGLALETAQNGHPILNKRTHARSLGTQELESDYPASNEIDMQVFLRGFDAGERFALLGVGISEQELENLMPSFVCPYSERSGSQANIKVGNTVNVSARSRNGRTRQGLSQPKGEDSLTGLRRSQLNFPSMRPHRLRNGVPLYGQRHAERSATYRSLVASR